MLPTDGRIEQGADVTVADRITKHQKRLRFVILLIGSLVMFSFLGADPILRTLRKRDQVGAEPQVGVAVVTTLVPPRTNETGDRMPPLATVRFRGHIYGANQVYDVARLKVDALARIEYRVGKSGRVYMDAVEALTPTVEPLRRTK